MGGAETPNSGTSVYCGAGGFGAARCARRECAVWVRVVPTVPICWVPVVPGGSVRASEGKLLGDEGALTPALGEGGL
jgi:ribosomal protein L16/L10AE